MTNVNNVLSRISSLPSLQVTNQNFPAITSARVWRRMWTRLNYREGTSCTTLTREGDLCSSPLSTRHVLISGKFTFPMPPHNTVTCESHSGARFVGEHAFAAGPVKEWKSMDVMESAGCAETYQSFLRIFSLAMALLLLRSRHFLGMPCSLLVVSHTNLKTSIALAW